jgi:hypothetical protein
MPTNNEFVVASNTIGANAAQGGIRKTTIANTDKSFGYRPTTFNPEA